MTPQIKLVDQPARFRRGMRRPKFDFSLHALPWQIVPFFIAPVIPGETMKKLSHLSRVVSDPVKDKLMGAHIEHSYFYVRHTDLDIASHLVEMHLDAAKDMAPQRTVAADLKRFRGPNAIDFVGKCLDSVVKWYFRDEYDNAARTIDGYPVAKVNQLGWWQSAKRALENPTTTKTHELPGENPAIPTGIPSGFAAHYEQWERMVSMSLTEATFEDYLASFGVRAPKNIDEEEQRPELLRHLRKWTYPTNTVEPTTGVPSSAWVWSCEHDASKDRLFKEPGFIIGVQVVRPKVHFSGITGTMSGYMDTAYNWLPAVLRDMDFTSLKQFTAAAPGPSTVAAGDDLWIDLKDLLLYGEQFRNHDLTENVSKAALPTGDAIYETEYPVLADAQGLFVGTTAPTRRIRTDGVVSLHIASSVHEDTSG